MKPTLILRKRIRAFLARLLTKEKYITAIFLLGLVLRLLGTYPGYPLTHPDEPTIATPSIRMAFEGNFRPQNYYYGSLLSLIYAITYIIFFIPLSFVFTLPTNPTYLNDGLLGYFQYLQKGPPLHELSFWSVNYWARYDSAIISSLTVVAAYLLGKKLFNKPIALIAAFLIAVNYRHVLSSRLILADAPAAFFALLAILLCVGIVNKNTLKAYLFAGIGVGLALSVKYFVYVIPTFILCHLLAQFQARKKSALSRIINLALNYKILLSIAAAALIFVAINPFLLLAREEAAYYWSANSARYGLRLSLDILQSKNLSYYSIYYLFYYGLGPVLSLLTVVGFFWSWLRYPKGSLIISSVAIPFLYTFLVVSGTGMVRNYAAIIPFALFFPAVLIFDFLQFISKLLRRRYVVTTIGSVLVLAIGYQSLYTSSVSGWYLAKEQNMISLYKWMDTNMPDGSKILGPSGVFYPAGRNFEGTKLTLEGNNLPSVEEISKSDASWIISSSIMADVGENLLLNKEITKAVFFNKELFNNLYLNNYSSLVFQELANYRVTEFAKPLSQDPPYMVSRVPSFWQAKEDSKVIEFNFNSPADLENWDYNYYSKNSYQFATENGAVTVTQTEPHCTSIFIRLSSPHFPVKSNTWYTLSVSGERDFNPLYKQTRNGFFRLDLYSANKRVKTYVTRTLSSDNKTQRLLAAGFAPENANTARVSFQIDSCLDGEEYRFDNVKVFSAKENPKVDKQLYPFFMQNHNQDFGWTPQL